MNDASVGITLQKQPWSGRDWNRIRRKWRHVYGCTHFRHPQIYLRHHGLWCQLYAKVWRTDAVKTSAHPPQPTNTYNFRSWKRKWLKGILKSAMYPYTVRNKIDLSLFVFSLFLLVWFCLCNSFFFLFSPSFSITVNLSLATLYLLLPLFQDLLSIMTSTGLLVSIIC